jgi:hypothetical protein
MKRCSICNDPEGVWTLDERGFGGNSTAVMYLCQACNKSARRALEGGVHVNNAVWLLKRLRSTQVKELKQDIERHKRDIEALTQLCQRQNKELHELRGDA